MLKSKPPRIVVRIAAGLIGILSLVLAGVACLALYWLTTVSDVSRLATINPSSTALMEARSREAQKQGLSSNPAWTWVPLASMSPHLQQAVIVAEDASFYSHAGFDWGGIRHAVAHNVRSGTLRRGGSTITQQLAKNLYLSSDKTLLRKANEALIALALERRLSKPRILELYLNVVEWGQEVYGAEAAAQHHFGKSALDVTPEEAALLAAILPAPRSYDPLPASRYLSARQQQILRWMRKKNEESVSQPSPEPPVELPAEPPVEPPREPDATEFGGPR